MEKTIKIGKTPVRLNNNIGWAIEYRNQFGQDIIPTIMPLLATGLDLLTSMLNDTGKNDDITAIDVLKKADSETIMSALVHLASIEFVDFINITWALAKCADEDIQEPREWIKQFDSFPMDIIAPAVIDIIMKGLISSKNLKRLNEQLKRIQPLQQKPSSSQEQSEG